MPNEGFSISVTGLQELSSYVATLPTLLKTGLTTNINEIFDQAYEQMQKDVPVRTGNLKRSIKKSGGQGESSKVLAQITVSAPYAGYVNFGTFRMRPRPFATSAYNMIISQLGRNMLVMK